jgi:hypothetical protein
MTNPFHYLIKPTPAEPETPLQLGLLCSPGPLERAPDKGVQPKAASVGGPTLETRFVICAGCGGEGIWDVPTGCYSDLDGSLHVVSQACSTCGGSGQVEEAPVGLTFEDLDQIRDDEADPYSAFGYQGGNP